MCRENSLLIYESQDVDRVFTHCALDWAGVLADEETEREPNFAAEAA